MDLSNALFMLIVEAGNFLETASYIVSGGKLEKVLSWLQSGSYIAIDIWRHAPSAKFGNVGVLRPKFGTGSISNVI